MKLIIKSKQDYGTNIEEYTEEFDCKVEPSENELKIEFENGFIQIEENKLTYERGENKIIIEPNKTNECDFETEYGMFVLDIKCISFENLIREYNIEENKSMGTILKARYEIQMVGVEPYQNNIEIILN